MNNPTPTRMNEFSWELPMALLTEVFARLPVKSLVRLRCVCKVWCSLICSSSFTSLHLACYQHNDDYTPILAVVSFSEKYQWMLLSGNTYNKSANDDYGNLNNGNIMDRFVNFFPCGISVNGLILLPRNVFDPLHDQWQIELVVWNPMIGKSPKVPTRYMHDNACLGFGFSRSSNDYKVVAIAIKPKTSVHIYSLSTCTWRSIIGYRKSCEAYSDGYALTEGKLDFIKTEKRSDIVLFDVNDEVLNCIDRPCVLGFNGYTFVYHEMVGLSDFDCGNHCCNLWVMENDQVPGSWCKLYTVGSPPASAHCMLCFKMNGKLMLLTMNGELEVYIVESGEMKHPGKSFSSLVEYVTVYKESLVLP